MLGLIYMVFGWVFQLSVADPIDAMKKAQYLNADLICLRTLGTGAAPEASAQCKTAEYSRVDETLDKFIAKMPDEVERKPQLPKLDIPDEEHSQSQPQDVAHAVNLKAIWRAVLLYVSPKRVVLGMLNNPAFLIMLAALWWGLVSYVDAAWNSRLVNFAARLTLGTLHFLAHLSLLLILTASFGSVIYLPLADGKNELWKIVAGVSAETFVIVLFGGLLGGIVWGIYWAVTSALFGMHMDAFSALGIKDYKNFLRMSFEPNRLTIYPVGLDKIPGRRGWRAPGAGEHVPDHNPLILPKRPMTPKLIEEPIVIEAGVSRAVG